MKKLIAGSALLLSAAAAGAQITIDQSSLPEIGDTLYTAVDNLPSDILITPPGEDQRWDFSVLQSPFTRRTVVRNPRTGNGAESFPDASLMMIQNDGAEAYFKKENGTLLLLGSSGADPLGLGTQILTRYQPPTPERHTPLRYLDTRQSESGVTLAFATDDLPRQILEQLPITPDSLRVSIQSERFDIVDAWGKIIIPGGIYDVLREKRIEIRHASLEAKLGLLPWQDITGLVPGIDQLGTLTFVTYRYLSNEAKEPIAVILLDENETSVLRAEYKSNDLTTDVQNIASLIPGVYAFPNPAIVNVRFEFSNLQAGYYTLTIYNILGVEVWRDTYFINGNHIEKVNISSLRKGTYLYSLTDKRGKTLTTKRLMVVKP